MEINFFNLLKNDFKKIRTLLRKIKKNNINKTILEYIEKNIILWQLASPENDYMRYILDNIDREEYIYIMDNIYDCYITGIKGDMQKYNDYSNKIKTLIEEHIITEDMITRYEQIKNYDSTLPSPQDKDTFAFWKYYKAYIYILTFFKDVEQDVLEIISEAVFYNAFLVSRTSITKTDISILLENLDKYPLDELINKGTLSNGISLN